MKQKKKSVNVEQQSSRHQLKKSKEKSEHKSQGRPAPAQHLKSGGDAFAYGLSKALGDAEAMKGSKQGFLGVETKMLDPTDFVEKDKLHVKKS